ncbi:hypothetical protein BKA67DRAFT_549476 [Truncatella angustata]|uniref:Uncharacterized protein n=1 Tax=Truncatella angustata TaxID=152316 RepID=A0A9P9A2N1_9PEZI|nr:uncharacterized protein BKA67DRAFT_549476 [Truncatella angustata]KAH6660886.1 hypothetical protein BKA67DRAFT_549476 [Truncatella angustata]
MLGYSVFEVERKRLFLLDQVVEGHYRTPGSRLLELPSYILVNIVDHLTGEHEALVSLVLANTDRQQLARFC